MVKIVSLQKHTTTKLVARNPPKRIICTSVGFLACYYLARANALVGIKSLVKRVNAPAVITAVYNFVGFMPGIKPETIN